MAAVAVELDMQRCVATFVSLLYQEAPPSGGEIDEHPLLSFAHEPLPTLPDSHDGGGFEAITLMDDYLVVQVDEKGALPLETKLTSGLAAALFGELVLRGLVLIKKNKPEDSILAPGSSYTFELSPEASKPTGSHLLDEALELMRKKPDEAGAVWWMRVLTNYHLHKGIKKLASRSREHAVHQGLLDKQEQSRLILFHTSRYFASGDVGSSYRDQLRDVIRNFALDKQRPSSFRRFALVALIFSLWNSRLPSEFSKGVKLSHIFSKEEKKIALANLESMLLHKGE